MSDLGSNEWACEYCTYHNNVAEVVCGMCDQPKSAGAGVSSSSGVVEGAGDDPELNAWIAAQSVMQDVEEEVTQRQFAYFEVSL